jgi:coenzyme PQQ synthesis protein D (PqqD)
MAERDILASRLVVPEHVFRRGFPEETVALNLDSGRYHGLNPVAARMLETAADQATIGAAVPLLAEEFGQPQDVIARDLQQLCRDLLDRGLVQLENGDAG